MAQQITQPTPAEIRAARIAAGKTQGQAAFCVHVDLRTWQKWESETEKNSRAIPPSAWELFLIKTSSIKS